MGLFSLHCPVSAGEQTLDVLQPQQLALECFRLQLEKEPLETFQ